ncbi:MAG: hypothetical protein HY360_01540 [Verrucomicrobia bacterium]|nr:hypothetical protein [Verrucomicrobiota bacterium]
MKTAIAWSIRLVVLAALAYFLQPLYFSPKPTQPSSRGAQDSVSWKFQSALNPKVSQALVVYGDGRSVATLLRPMGDPDTPEAWKIRRDKESGMIEFTKENLVSVEGGRALFQGAIDAGILDLQPEPAPAEQVEVQMSFGGATRKIAGPQHVASAADWRPNVWRNRMRWQKIAGLIQNDAALQSALTHKEVKLVNE